MSVERNTVGQWIKVSKLDFPVTNDSCRRRGGCDSEDDNIFANTENGYSNETKLNYSPDSIEYTVKIVRNPLSQPKTLLVIFALVLGLFMSVPRDFQFSVSKQLIVVTCLILFAIVHLRRTIIQESILVVNALGIQLEQTNALGRSSIRFVPNSKIKGIIINETIRRHRIISYIAVLLRVPDLNNKLILPLFVEVLPRLQTLEIIHNDLQRQLRLN